MLSKGLDHPAWPVVTVGSSQSTSPVLEDGSDGAAPVRLPRVLVVDDVEDIATAIAECLEDIGYVVQVVHNGRDAWECCRAAPFDAVITDLSMPVMNGYELIERLRQHRPSLPVIVLTGQKTPSNELALLATGVACVLAKPPSFYELTEKLNYLVVR